jgi:protoheme IX farnesyltransferase
MEDYKNANIPMLPVISGVKVTKLNIFVYALLLFPIILAPFFLNYFGIIYLLISGTLAIYYIYICYKLFRAQESNLEKKIAKQVFGFSILFLFLVFTSILIDSIV